MITCLLTFCALLFTAPQVDDAADTARAAPLTDPAEAVLDHAARFQRGDTPLAARPQRFHGRFFVKIYKPEGGTVTVDVERSWMRDPERVLTRRRDGVLESDTSVGFDGEVAWFQDHSTGEVIRYTDDPVAFEADLALLRHDLRFTALLIEASLIDSLRPRLRDLRVVGAARMTDADGEQHTVTELAAVMDDEIFGPDPSAPPPSPGASAPRLTVRLFVDDETGAVRRVRLATLDRAEVLAMELRILLHHTSTQGLQMPAMLELYENGARSLELGVVPDESGALLFEIDPDFDASRFFEPGSEAARAAAADDAPPAEDDAR